MVQGKVEKSVSIDELRETTGSLKAWRTGALVRLARKQTERVIRRETRRSGSMPVVDVAPPSKRNRHAKR
jgi:hypothetical protein